MSDNVGGSYVRLHGVLRVMSYGTMYVVLLMLGLHYRHCRALGNDILGLAIPTEPTLDANTVCKTYPGLSHRQYNICRRFPDVAASAIQGVQIAIHECQYQFRAHRWNCSALETKNKNPYVSPFLTRGVAVAAAGFRETAFAYAITAAGMTTQVARACSLGKLTSCGCSKKMDDQSGQWKWRGCNHNMEFANHYVQRFLRLRERAKDIHSQTNRHNNHAGRLVVRRNQRLLCKCHGMSGSCEVKTCWKAAPPFRTIGAILKKKYERASKVDNSNSAKGKLRLLISNHRHRTKKEKSGKTGGGKNNRGKGRRRQRRSRRRPRNTNLVYFERSPNFCDENPASSGTVGRYCNRTSEGIDNCETLCCGRGYNTLKVTRSERCECRFHWCCYVVCKTCVFTQWVTVCK